MKTEVYLMWKYGTTDQATITRIETGKLRVKRISQAYTEWSEANEPHTKSQGKEAYAKIFSEYSHVDVLEDDSWLSVNRQKVIETI